MNGTGLDLAEALEALRRRIPWLIGGTLLGLLLGLIALRVLPPSYRSEATLLVESPWFPQGFVPNPMGKSMRERLQTLEHRLTSDAALAAIAEQVGPERFGSGSSAQGALRGGFTLELAEAASPDSAVVRVAFVSRDPELARDVVRAVSSYALEEARQEGERQAAATAGVLRDELELVGRDLAEKSERLAVLAEQTPAASAAGGDDSARTQWLADLQAIQALEAEVARAETRYTTRHPELRQLRTELARRRAALSAPTRPRPASDASAESSAESTAEYRSLLREYESGLQTYQSLLTRRIDATMAERLEQSGALPEIRVLREAWLPARPFAPDPLLFLAGGAGSGLALAALLAVLPGLRRPTFSGVEALADASGLPVIAALPELPLAETMGARALVRPESAAGEQFRRVLPHLSRASGTPVVLVTGAERGAGASWCAANLAAVAATDGQRRTLLVDGDLRSPSLGALLGVGNGPGLLECVRGDHSLARAALPTSVPNLFVLRAGEAKGSVLAAFQDERLWKLIEDARREFGAVFIDAPPRAVVDATLVERLGTLLLFVVRADRTPRASVASALRGVELPVALILNGVHGASWRRHFSEDAGPPSPPRVGNGR